jgi:hypothetical protein
MRSAGGRYLRANGKYLRWRVAVTVAGDDGSTMLQWAVEAVPIRLERPTLIDPPPQVRITRHSRIWRPNLFLGNYPFVVVDEC